MKKDGNTRCTRSKNLGGVEKHEALFRQAALFVERITLSFLLKKKKMGVLRKFVAKIQGGGKEKERREETKEEKNMRTASD